MHVDGDLALVSSGKRLSDANATGLVNSNSNETINKSSDDPLNRDRRSTATGLTLGGGNIFNSFKRIFNPGITNITNDQLNRTPTFCVSSSIPTREVNHWVNIFLFIFIGSFEKDIQISLNLRFNFHLLKTIRTRMRIIGLQNDISDNPISPQA
jgi:hypothetical protein